MIAIGASNANSIQIGQVLSEPTVYVGNSLVWSALPDGVVFTVTPLNALLRQNEPLAFDVETEEAATFNWYSGSTLVSTGTSYTPSASTLGEYTLRVAAVVDGEEKNSVNIDYEVRNDLAVVTDPDDKVSLNVQFVGESIDLYRFLEYQPFNTIMLPRNTIVNGFTPALSSGYAVTPAYHTVLMDTDKTVTFTVTQQ